MTWWRVKPLVRVPMPVGKVRVSKTAGIGSTTHAVHRQPAPARQPIARCITGFLCSACKPDYNIALAMGLHKRLGEASPLANLTDDLLRKIIESTKPRRTLAAWMSCSFSVRYAATPQATRDCHQVSSRDEKHCYRRETMLASPSPHPIQTAREKPRNRPRALVT
jgi:hypothetical protein